MDTPALPRTAADLSEWSVFADHLLTIGDPRGEALALELAMSATPTAEELAAFHAKCPRLPAPDAKLQFGYQLGHVVALAIAPAPAHKMAHVLPYQTPEQGALARAQDLLSTPTFARLAELQLPFSTLTPELARLLRRLPATCSRLVLTFGHSTVELAEPLLAAIPPQVETVMLVRCTPAVAQCFFTGRFAMIELERVAQLELAAVLDRAPATQARVSYAYAWLHPRTRLGEHASAGFVEPVESPVYDVLARAAGQASVEEPIARVVPRRTLLDLQARFGVIPIRSQLARTLPDHQYVVFGNAPAGVELLHANERWTIRSTEPFAVDEVVVEPKTVAELADGARVMLGNQTLEFVTRDLEARFRARTSR